MTAPTPYGYEILAFRMLSDNCYDFTYPSSLRQWSLARDSTHDPHRGQDITRDPLIKFEFGTFSDFRFVQWNLNLNDYIFHLFHTTRAKL